MVRWNCCLVFCCVLVTTDLISQDSPPDGGATRAEPNAADASAAAVSPLDALKSADEAGRAAALEAYIEAQLATGAVFAGQYDELGKLEWDAMPILRGWIEKPPSADKSKGTAIAVACVNALRDCVAKPSEELLVELQAVAMKPGAPAQLSARAKYALAQFGKTEHVDSMIEAAMKKTSSASLNQKIGGWNELADVYYNIRRYEDAAKAYRQVIMAIEGANPNYSRFATIYYNCACSYALAGNKQDALEHVKRALQKGKLGVPLRATLLQTDMDIRSLRGEPEFAALMYEYFKIGEAPASQPSSEPAAESKPSK